MALKIYNTLTRKVEPFKSIEPGKAGMYVCGVTVYDDCHIGHGRTFIAFDVARRWLEKSGYEVKFVRNITDVDDKIIKRSAERGILPEELSKIYAERMQEDFAELGCLPPTHEPRATAYIPQMLSLIEKLEEKGYAYQDKGGDVDFAVRNFKNYGELSGKKIDELRAGERVSIDETKRDPLDFVLWKKAKPGEPQWDSKWGKGRPGWHIECSAMACELLGETIDIHAGGPDLKFPHHENEIAQSQAATGKKFVNTWMHSGPLRVNGEKMSKSLGNFWTIRDALKETNKQYGQGNGNETLRFFLLKSQYRSPIDFSSALVEDAHTGLTRLYNALKEVAPDEQPLDWNEKHAAKFKEAMDDDFNTALAVSVLFELANEVNSTKSPELARQLKKLGEVLGLLQLNPEKFIKGAVEGVDVAWVEEMIQKRKDAKKNKDFGTADAIRQELKDKGIVLEDKPGGITEWKKA
ncbi:cysteine--tRNA ligase [Turicimonas muris]|uniref:cysteine--tRNA ligase n=2 Tax=Turicimonas muris TaxID=1796652 RepID=UPI00248B49CA|nr:cysteine--tRNA ligase [Turicimonas muris]